MFWLLSEHEQECRVIITYISEKVDSNVCNSFNSFSDSELTEEWLSVKIEQDTDRLKHHWVFSIANIQDKTWRRKQGVQMCWRKLCIAGHMTQVRTTIL